MAGPGAARYGMVRHGLAWLGEAGPGLAWRGAVRHAVAGSGKARQGYFPCLTLNGLPFFPILAPLSAA